MSLLKAGFALIVLYAFVFVAGWIGLIVWNLLHIYFCS